MKSLKEKVEAGMTEEERCDVLFSMVQRVEDGQPIGGGPEEVFITEDNCIHINRQGNLPNLLFSPPELIENTKAAIGKPQRWFTLGMHAYYMYYKTDFYSQKHTALLAPRPGKQNVILPADVKEIPFGAAVSSLTAVDPSRRIEGLKLFLQYLREKVKGTASIQYVLDGKVVGKQIKELTEDIEDLWPNGRVKINETVYEIQERPVKIPYRPGTHTYRVPVAPAGKEGAKYTPRTKAGLYLYYNPNPYIESKLYQSSGGQIQLLSLNKEDNENQMKTFMNKVRLSICRLSGETTLVQSQPLGYIDVEKPKNYQGASYLIKLWYVAKTKCVKLHLTSESGVSIAPARSVSMETLQ